MPALFFCFPTAPVCERCDVEETCSDSAHANEGHGSLGSPQNLPSPAFVRRKPQPLQNPLRQKAMQTAPLRMSTVVESNQPLSVRSGSHKQSSCLSDVLEEAWSELRDLIAGLPPAVLLVLSAREYRR